MPVSHDLISLRVWIDSMRAAPDAGAQFERAADALSRLLGDTIDKADALERATVLQATLLTKAVFADPGVVRLPAIPRHVPLQGGDLA
jgi:hypothetical protein